MARGPDGKTARPDEEPEEETTRRVQRKSIRDRIAAGGDSAEAETRIAGSGEGKEPAKPEEPSESDAPPEVGHQEEKPRSAPRASANEDAKTQIYRPKRGEPSQEEGAKSSEPAADRPRKGGDEGSVSDPVVGWIVVVEGPGRGASFPLGYGNNRIGRAPTETVSLDFGDNQISRENHATITYDGKNRRFFVKEGGGRNLIYVGDDPVLVPVELAGDEVLTLGETKLRFVPFCGKDFDWNEQ